MTIVNIKKKVLSLVVCVAAIVLSGCTAADATRNPDVAPTAPQESTVEPQRYDELVLWTNGDTMPEMVAYGDMVGVEIYIPYASYLDDGFIGIGPLGDNCVVAFHGTMEMAEQGLMSAAVMTRYDHEFEVGLPDATIDEVKAFIDQMRPECTVASGTPA